LSWDPVDDRPGGHFVDGVLAGLPEHVLTHPVFAARGFQQRPVIKLHQVVGMDIGPKNNVAPSPTIPTIRAASRHKFFPPKTDAPISAIPGLGVNSNPVNEHGVQRSAFSGQRSRSAFRNEEAKRDALLTSVHR
jgi:hypothetical protein